MPRLLHSMLLCLGLGPGLAAAGPPVTVEGHSRVDPDFIDDALERCGRDGLMAEPDSIRRCLFDTRLFADVVVQRSGDGFVAKVDERWTLVPLPVVRSEAGNTEGGLFLLESNLFGAGKLLVLGGLYGTRGSQIRAIYRDPSVFYSDWTATLTFARQAASVVHEDGPDVLDRFDEQAHRAQLSIGHRLGRFAEVSGVVAASWRAYTVSGGFEAPDDLRDIELGLDARWRRTRFRLYFDEGLSLNAAGRVQVNRGGAREPDGERLWRLSVAAGWQTQTFGGQALQLRSSAMISRGADARTALRLGSQPGLRGAPIESIWSERHAALGLDYQIPLWRPSFGTITAAPFGDLALVSRVGVAAPDPTLHAAAGAGLYLYLRDVAFPGVGLVAGYARGAGPFATASVGAGW